MLLNPETKRQIKRGGYTHLDLIRRGVLPYYSLYEPQYAPKVSRPQLLQQPMTKTLQTCLSSPRRTQSCILDLQERMQNLKKYNLVRKLKRQLKEERAKKRQCVLDLGEMKDNVEQQHQKYKKVYDRTSVCNVEVQTLYKDKKALERKIIDLQEALQALQGDRSRQNLVPADKRINDLMMRLDEKNRVIARWNSWLAQLRENAAKKHDTLEAYIRDYNRIHALNKAFRSKIKALTSTLQQERQRRLLPAPPTNIPPPPPPPPPPQPIRVPPPPPPPPQSTRVPPPPPPPPQPIRVPPPPPPPPPPPSQPTPTLSRVAPPAFLKIPAQPQRRTDLLSQIRAQQGAKGLRSATASSQRRPIPKAQPPKKDLFSALVDVLGKRRQAVVKLKQGERCQQSTDCDGDLVCDSDAKVCVDDDTWSD